MKQTTYFNVIKILSVVGIFLAFYLFFNFLTKPVVQICTINSKVNCDEVTTGSLSLFYGVPVSLVGLLGYIFILIGALLKNNKAVLAFSLFGMLFCLRLTFLEFFVVHVICPVCIMCQIVMLALSVLAIYKQYAKVE